jgi:3-hydroxybutyryl-CoA dehydrogenase
MGPGIAVDYLLAGYPVTLMGRDVTKLEAAYKRVEAALEFLVSEDFVSVEKRAEGLERLSTGLLSEKSRLEAATVIVESITEDLAVKQRFFEELETVCRPDALFLTNTSGLSVTEIFAKLRHPERGMGTHYWNPPYLMPLVELTPGEKTSPALADKIQNLLEGMGKKPVRVRRELPGLIWNRLQFALFRECLYLLEQGVATPAEIDRVVSMGLARRASFMGLFAISDLGGSDVWYTIASYLFGTLGNAKEPPELWREQIERGEFGLKSGQGFYKWDDPEQARQLVAARDRYLLAKLKEDQTSQS